MNSSMCRRGLFITVLAVTCIGQVCQEQNQDNDNIDGDTGTGENTPFTGAFREVPDPLSGDNPTYKIGSVSVPAVGASVSYDAFGTSQTRVVQSEDLRHEYSRHDPFNADQSMIVLTDVRQGGYRVYRTQSMPYDQSGQLVTDLNIEEPRWDPNDTNLIWGLQDFSIVTINVQTNQITTIKDFSQDATVGPIIAAQSDLYRITMRDEGESSTDKRYWAFLLQGMNDDYRPRYLFTWDRQTDQVLGLHTLTVGESSIDWVGMSPHGNWVLIGGDYNNGGQLTGLTLANRELTQFHRLDYGVAHSDVGLDTQGNEIIVMQNVQTDYIDMIPLANDTLPILQAGGDYSGTHRVPLVRLFYDSESPVGLNSGIHISCNYPGYAVVSTYIESGMAERNWLDRSIILIELDPIAPRTFYLSKVYGTTDAYWEETQAAITSDGRRVVWATNWNRNVGRERVWLMQLDMPTYWENQLDN